MLEKWVWKKDSDRAISGRVDGAFATKMVDFGSILGRVKSNTIKIDIHSFSAWRSAIKGRVWSLRCVLWTGGSLLEDQKVLSLSPGQGKLVNKI